MIKIDLSQLLDFFWKFVSKVFNYELQKLFDKLQIINKNLQEIFNSHFLMLFQGKLALRWKFLFIFCVFDKCFCNFFYNVQNLLLLASSHTTLFFHFGNISACNGIILFLQEFWNILLQALYFFFEIVYLFIDDLESFFIVMSIFNFDLNE